MTEVKLTRINTNPFTSNPKWDRFKTQVEFDKEKWYSDLPVDDFRELLNIYQQVPHNRLNLNPIDFVFKINNRVYAEWCMSPDEGGKDWNLHRDYRGDGFTSFVNKEIHYELERQRSEADRGSHEGYIRARQRVLGGLTLKAIDLFSEWGDTYPKDCYDKKGMLAQTKDKRNLRDTLRDYITIYNDLREMQTKAA